MYRIELSQSAAKELSKVFRSDRTLYQRFLHAFETLSRDPSLGKPLHGKLQGLRSYRMGNYRILYEVRHSHLMIVVVELGHRREIYR
ncbi:MAG: type II toxin-antitoxin system RelE/ParE family toxin [Elusimicrobia bacterium]|nr:type II toxin-antitoxin system RelE/ParE family toxin [Elusimicrobiota bacterium]